MSNEYWKNQSKSFDQSAEYYDRYRPSYPSKLIEDLIIKVGLNEQSKLLEIGAGSGKATELFVNKGLNITCIEPGKHLADKGLKKFKGTNQVHYIVNRFEGWDEDQNTYDLVFSAQAFHWVPKPIGYEKCYRSLKENQYMALFWNYYLKTDKGYDDELHELFKEYPLGYLDTNEGLEQKIKHTAEEIESSGYFKNIEVIRYPWSLEYDMESYIGFIKTSNGYLTLDEEIKTKVIHLVKDIIKRNGGKITRNYMCTLYLAQKK